eukprot:2124611-Pyramimonas_sp.AAC.1
MMNCSCNAWKTQFSAEQRRIQFYALKWQATICNILLLFLRPAALAGNARSHVHGALLAPSSSSSSSTSCALSGCSRHFP